MGPPAKWLSGRKTSTAGSNPALPATEKVREQRAFFILDRGPRSPPQLRSGGAARGMVFASRPPRLKYKLDKPFLEK